MREPSDIDSIICCLHLIIHFAARRACVRGWFTQTVCITFETAEGTDCPIVEATMDCTTLHMPT